jgi:hypothetical protein
VANGASVVWAFLAFPWGGLPCRIEIVVGRRKLRVGFPPCERESEVVSGHAHNAEKFAMKALAVAIGFLLVLAYTAAVRGQQSNPGLKATAESSTDIIVAEVLDTNPRKAIEGARDTVQLKVVRTLKGPLEPGQQIGVYYHLLWVDTEKWILENPKFEEGKHYTVFLIESNGYTLTDQWFAVLPEHPRLAMDVVVSLNEVGDLWSNYWRRQQKGAVVSRLRIDVVPQATVARTKDGLILSAEIVNHSSEEVRTRLAHEWHGGEWPATDLYASVSHVQAERPSSFEPVYLKGEKREEIQETRIAPGKSVAVELRMDWPGTGSVPCAPLMTPSQSEYHVRLLMAFDSGRNAREYAAGALKHVRLAVE